MPPGGSKSEDPTAWLRKRQRFHGIFQRLGLLEGGIRLSTWVILYHVISPSIIWNIPTYLSDYMGSIWILYHIPSGMHI